MTVIVSETPEQVAERVARDFRDTVKQTVAEKGRFCVALSGGVTPKTLYACLAQNPYRSEIPWDKLRVFWGDERCVPPDHPESNYGMAQQTLLQYVPVSPNRVFRMRGEDPPDQAARDYEKVLRNIFASSPWPVFDLIFLGMGADGHTASLIADSPALNTQEQWVAANVIRSLQTVRITLTLPAINHARAVWFVVCGAKKKAAFARVQEGSPPNCPASLVRPVDGDLRWYVDQTVVAPSAKPLTPSN